MPYTMWIKYLLALLIGFGLINSSYGKLSLSQYVAKRAVWEKNYFIFRWYVVETAIKRKIFLIVSTNEKRWKYLERVNFSDEKQKISTQVVKTNEKHRQAANPRKYFFHDIFVRSIATRISMCIRISIPLRYKRKIETEYKKSFNAKIIFFANILYFISILRMSSRVHFIRACEGWAVWTFLSDAIN